MATVRTVGKQFPTVISVGKQFATVRTVGKQFATVIIVGKQLATVITVGSSSRQFFVQEKHFFKNKWEAALRCHLWANVKFGLS